MRHDKLRIFTSELKVLLGRHLPFDRPLLTLSSGKPNWIAGVVDEGVLVETEKSRAADKPAQLVPAWMFEVAWQRLRARGKLTNRELLSSEELGVKRSSLVCAALATLPGVTVVSPSPIVLEWD